MNARALTHVGRSRVAELWCGTIPQKKSARCDPILAILNSCGQLRFNTQLELFANRT